MISAVETGLSSDPPMNWRVSFLDRYRLISNSDTHSPGKFGREATTFDCELDCIRLTNEDVIDLYNRVKTGALVVVLGPKQGPARVASAGTAP